MDIYNILLPMMILMITWVVDVAGFNHFFLKHPGNGWDDDPKVVFGNTWATGEEKLGLEVAGKLCSHLRKKVKQQQWGYHWG